MRWDSLFSGAEEVPIDVTGKGAIAIDALEVDPQGNLIIPDPRNDRILFLDSRGQLIRQVGGKGEGPGEFKSLRSAALDSAGNLLVFDQVAKRVSVFTTPEYTFSRSFDLDPVLASMIGLPSQSIVAFCPTEEERLLKFDLEGRTVRRAFRPKRERIGTFLARTHTGGLSRDPRGDGFYFIYPDEFAIFHYDSDLNIKRVIRSPSASSHWRPRMPGLPDSLSPYDFDPAHKQWWDSHLHIDRIFSLDKDLLLVTLYETQGFKDQARYLNIYTSDGLVIAEGIRIPHPLRIVGTAPGVVYAATLPYLDAEERLHPPTLQRYSFLEVPVAADRTVESPSP
ncbi:MAG TPA: 6-bladed beta-propeller [Acidobacteriota bacterium]|nr:6-bladed beta-propeller [Acidobacteriota bacterium]